MKILAVHPYSYSEEHLQNETKMMWGECEGGKLAEARRKTKEQFDNVFIFEIETDEENPNFSELTQENTKLGRSSWQVPYDERRIDEFPNRWAFFFHFPDFTKPLIYKGKPLLIPKVTPCPEHLLSMLYEVP